MVRYQFFIGIIGVGFSRTKPRRGQGVREENIFCKNSANRSIMSALLVAIVCFGRGRRGGVMLKSKYWIRT